MRYLLASALLFCHFMCAVLVSAAQTGRQTEPNTLLWRIQGKTSDKPCYLYGTMHVKDKKVFHFSDSLYAALEGVEGFAMEVHPDSMVAMLFRHALEENRQRMVRDILTKAEMAKLDVKVKKELGISADKLTTKDAFLLKERLSLPENGGEEMQTFMDAYLYSIARDRQKRIAGLERPEDQEAILEEMETKFDPHSLVNDNGEAQRFTSGMIDVYARGNLRRLDSLVQVGSDSASLSSLYKRNRVMLHSMDSLFGTGSFFVAVGAAHLSGDSGLIQLLRVHGYNVTPVVSAKKMEPDSYVFQKQKDKDWVSIRMPDDGYEVSLPGTPQEIALDAGMSMRIYADITNNSFFETVAGPVLIKTALDGKDSLLDGMVKRMAEKVHATVQQRTAIVQDSLKGFEVTMFSSGSGLTITIRMFVSGRHFYLMAMGYAKKASVPTYAKDRFFGSLSVFTPEGRRQRTEVTSPVYHCAFTSPGKDVVRDVPVQTGYRGVYHFMTDPVTQNIFSVTMASASVGHELGSDSSRLATALDMVKASLSDSVMTFRDTVLLGCHALSLRGGGAAGPLWRAIIIKRDNYLYKLMAFGQEDSVLQPEADSFFSAFRLLSFGQMAWATQSSADSVFVTRAPAYVFHWENDGGNTTRWVDTVRMDTYIISDYPVNPYAFSVSDTGFLVERFKQRFPHNSYFLTTQRGLPTLTYMDKDTSAGHRIRGAYILNGNKIYEQVAYVSPARGHAPEVDQFFDSLQFKEPVLGPFLKTGPEKLLADLHNPDTTLRQAAHDYMDSAEFEAGDLPLMLASLMENFPEDSLGAPYTRDLLEAAIRKVLSERSLPLLGRTYRDLPDTLEDRRYDLLAMMGDIQTKAAFDTLLELMQFRMPVSGSVYRLFYKLKDSLALTKQICPGLMRFQGDTLLGPRLFDIYNRLVDSGMMRFAEYAGFEKAAVSFGYGYLERNRKSTDNFDGRFDDMTDFLKRFKDTTVAAFFRSACVRGSLPERFSAACGLQYMGQTAPITTLQALAADEYWRVALFDSLKAYGQQRRFPQEQFTQIAFAKSYLARVETGDDDMDDDTHPVVRFLRSGIYSFKGKKSTFLLCSVRYAGQDSAYLGVVGPYKTGSTQPFLEKNGDATGVYIQRAIDRVKLDAQVRLYLAGLTDPEDETKP